MRGKMIDNLINVFISSKDKLEMERDAIEEVLIALNMNPIRAETTKHYATPNSEEYLRQLKKSHIVILLIDLEAQSSDMKKYYQFVKDEINSAFVMGLPVLAFFKITKNLKAIDKFVDEIQYKLFSHKFKTIEELKECVRDSVLNELFRKYVKTPSLLSSSRQIYSETIELMKKCNYRFYLSQQTPTILLGPRKGRQYEKVFHKILFDLIERAKTNNVLELVFVYDSTKTDVELENNIIDYETQEIQNNIFYLKNVFQKNPEINLHIIDRESNVVQFVISDSNYLFGNHTNDIAFAVLDENPLLIKEMDKEIMKITSYPNDSGLNVFESLFDKYNF